MIYTFYSYKGGVGRTMALANVAELLCRRGLRVVMAECNVESPALEHYFPSVTTKALTERGLVDLIQDFKLVMSEPHEEKEGPLPLPDINKYLLPVTAGSKDGSLLLLPPGARAGGINYARYTGSVRLFDWHDFYRNWEGRLFFEWLRRSLKDKDIADVVLVNSSPGISELSSVCTRTLADAVVMFCSASRQNIQGTYEMASELLTAWSAQRPARPARLLVVPARVKEAEAGLLKKFRDEFVEKFSGFLPEGARDGREFFWGLKIPDSPYYSFREEVAAREPAAEHAAEMVGAYEKLVGAMAALAPPGGWLQKLSSAGSLTVGQSLPQPALDGRPPYRGLEPFYQEHAHLFYGRKQSIEKLREMVKTAGVVVVTGQSGSGKSSLVYAGLLPEVAAGRLPGSEHWALVTFKPGDDPFVAMAAALAPLLRAAGGGTRPVVVRDLSARLATSEVALGEVVRQILEGRPASARLLMIIDQFEELFTLVPGEDVRLSFQNQLLNALRGGRLNVVATMRADFRDSLQRHKPLAAEAHGRVLDLDTMTTDEYLEAIVMPANKAGVEFEVGLVERILADVGREPGNLPLLQFALMELWNLRQGGKLTHAAYDQIGGVKGAVTRRAGEIVEELGKEREGLVRRIFTQLVHIGEDGGTENTRRRATFEEMGKPAEEVREIVKALVEARLLVCNSLSGGGDTSEEYIEVAHEALIRDWGQLKKWVDDERQFLLWRQHLRRRMSEWELVRKGVDERLRLEKAAADWKQIKERKRDEASGRGRAGFMLRAGSARLRVFLIKIDNALLHLSRAASRSVLKLEGSGALLRDFPLNAASWWLRQRGEELSPDEKKYIKDSVRRRRVQQWTVRVLLLAAAAVFVFIFAKQMRQTRTIENIAGDLYGRGLAQQQTDPQGALQSYSQVLELDPNYADARIRRAEIYAADGKYREAVDDYENYLSLKPDDPAAYNGLGAALLGLGGERDLDAALQNLNKAILLKPDYDQAFYNRARLYDLKSQSELALQDYERVVHLNPAFYQAYVSLGNLYNERGKAAGATEDLARALQSYEQAVKIIREKGTRPGENTRSYADAFRYLGSFYEEAGDHVRAVEIKPEEADEQYRLAVENFNEAIKLNADLAEAYYGRGRVHKDLNQTVPAIQDFEKAKQLKPTDVAVYNQLAALYKFENNYEQAIATYREALNLEPENVEALRGLGDSFEAKGDHASAIENFKKAIDLTPPRDRTDLYLSLGASYVAQNMKHDAREIFKTVLRESGEDARRVARRYLEKLDYDALPYEALVSIWYGNTVALDSAEAVRNALADAGFKTTGPSPTSQELQWVSVRNYHKQDRKNAEAVAGIVGEVLKTNDEAWDVRRDPFLKRGNDNNFGLIEVYISAPAPAPAPQR
jgi:tetratricopeptide (TPR) repeat protein